MGFFFSKPEMTENEVEFLGMKFGCTEEYFIQTYREEGELVFIILYYYYWLWIAFLNWIAWIWEPFDKAKFFMIE